MKNLSSIFNSGLELLLTSKKNQKSLPAWFEYQDVKRKVREGMRAEGLDPDCAANAGELLCRCVRDMHLEIPVGSALAGTQDDAFSPSYALINPTFKVESFAGYCDPVAIYNDITEEDGIPQARIDEVREYYRGTPYVKQLREIYSRTTELTDEVAFFMEPVTGHMIPDMRSYLAFGFDALTADAPESGYAPVMKGAAEAVKILAARYAELAESLKEGSNLKLSRTQ